ncbi:armadillo repeat only 4 [Striga asiatica]|uniref:Armadillo repeat only 4 n=1 Tax=Striga asiatica TaxID=4170 RepID=A0A5A7R198_STRAF|nr:armadillo repeat only 4 [Striga asiatica]
MAAKQRQIEHQEKCIDEVLSYPIILADQISHAVLDSDSFKLECSEVRKHADHLSQMLFSAARLAASAIGPSAPPFYDRPLRRISADVSRNFEKTLTLVKKCRHCSTLCPVVIIIFATYFPRRQNRSRQRARPLARDNNRNKQIIVEEGGILPLLKLLKNNFSIDAQIAAASAQFSLANEEEWFGLFIDDVLGDSPMKVRIRVANLVAKMAKRCPLAKEDLARENVIRPLIKLLVMDDPVDEKPVPDLKLKLKVSCAEALWMLAKGSVQNSWRITKTKGLLCLAKLVETEEGELQYNCLMTIMEITAAAESNADLQRAAFKPNSPAAKAVVDQLLTVIKQSDDVRMQSQDVAAEAVGSLGKFECSENFLCVEHCKTITEFGGVPPLMRLLRGDEKARLNGLVLVCYLAIHGGKSGHLEWAGVLGDFEGVDGDFIAQHPELRDLVSQAVYLYQLSVFRQSHPGLLAQRHSSLLVAQRQF